MLFVAAIIAVPTVITWFNRPVPGFSIVMGMISVLVLGLLGYFAWAAKNLRYELDDKNLIIRWAFNKKVVPFASIRGFNRMVGTSAAKVVGASLPGFHLGSFTNPTGKGSINLFATRLWGDILLIRTKWEVVGITPENPEEFLEDLSQHVHDLQPDNLTGDEREVAAFSPWRQKHFLAVMGLTAVIIIGTGLYLFNTIPNMPSQIPMHYNLYGQVDRYGSPSELWVPYGIGVSVVLFLSLLNGVVAKNNKTSAYLMAYTSLFIALLFSIISISI